MREAATETSWFGETSIRSTSSGLAWTNSPPRRLDTSSADELALLVELGVGLGDGVLLLLQRRVEGRLAGHPALLHLAVRGLDEAELVHPGEGGERAR